MPGPISRARRTAKRQRGTRRPTPYLCTWSDCSATLSGPFHLRQHIREKHTHEKPHVCETCANVGRDSRFARRGTLLRHLRHVHGIGVSAPDHIDNHTACPTPKTPGVKATASGPSVWTYPSPAFTPAALRSKHIDGAPTSPVDAREAMPPKVAPAPPMDYFANDYLGPTRCAFCQTVVGNIRTHVNLCVRHNSTTPLAAEHTMTFDEQLADMDAFGAELDVYQAQFGNQAPTPAYSPLTDTVAGASVEPADTKLFDEAAVEYSRNFACNERRSSYGRS